MQKDVRLKCKVYCIYFFLSASTEKHTEKTAKLLTWTWPQQNQTNQNTSWQGFCSI